MKLGDWLKMTKTRQYVFAQRIGVTASVVSDYVHDRMVPSPERWERIVAETGGAVTPNDHLSDGAQKTIADARREPAGAVQ